MKTTHLETVSNCHSKLFSRPFLPSSTAKPCRMTCPSQNTPFTTLWLSWPFSLQLCSQSLNSFHISPLTFNHILCGLSLCPETSHSPPAGTLAPFFTTPRHFLYPGPFTLTMMCLHASVSNSAFQKPGEQAGHILCCKFEVYFSTVWI